MSPAPLPGRLSVAIVAANTFQYDSRLRRTASALAEDGHAVTVVAFTGEGLPSSEPIAERAEVRRIDLDRRIASGLRPLPPVVRRAVLRAVGLDPDATGLPVGPASGADRLRVPIRRGLEILAAVRRMGPWTAAVVAAAPDAAVVHTKALIALPVARDAARRNGQGRGRFVYDVADLHTESARLVRLPRFMRKLIRRREGSLVREAAAVLAVTPAMSGEVSRRFGIPPPPVVLNCPPAWHPERPEPVRSKRLAAALRPMLRKGERPSIVLYQGSFRPDQGIEELVAALDQPALAAAHVVAAFLGFGQLEQWLQTEASVRPGRMAVLPAVPDNELLDWTAGADVAFVGAPPRTLNQRLTLPNKLFQSLMAGVPIVVGEGTEHCRLARREGVGRCCNVNDPAAIAATIGGLLAQPAAERETLRRRCREVALERYTWETARISLLSVYRRLAADAAEWPRRRLGS